MHRPFTSYACPSPADRAGPRPVLEELLARLPAPTASHATRRHPLLARPRRRWTTPRPSSTPPTTTRLGGRASTSLPPSSPSWLTFTTSSSTSAAATSTAACSTPTAAATMVRRARGARLLAEARSGERPSLSPAASAQGSPPPWPLASSIATPAAKRAGPPAALWGQEHNALPRPRAPGRRLLAHQRHPAPEQHRHARVRAVPRGPGRRQRALRLERVPLLLRQLLEQPRELRGGGAHQLAVLLPAAAGHPLVCAGAVWQYVIIFQLPLR